MTAFTLKKFFATLLMPMSLISIALILGLVLWLFTRRQQLGKKLVIVGVCALYLLSIKPVSQSLLSPLESPYQALNSIPANLDFIVVLGCSHISDDSRPITSQVHPCSTARLLEAIRIQELAPDAKIVLSSGIIKDPVSNADKMLALAKALGYEESRFVISNEGRDTEEEAEALASLLTGTQSVLVTQASHMTRALRLFARHQVSLTPAPTYFRISKSDSDTEWRHFVPSPGNLVNSTNAIYEMLGNIWISLKFWWRD